MSLRRKRRRDFSTLSDFIYAFNVNFLWGIFGGAHGGQEKSNATEVRTCNILSHGITSSVLSGCADGYGKWAAAVDRWRRLFFLQPRLWRFSFGWRHPVDRRFPEPEADAGGSPWAFHRHRSARSQPRPYA